MRFRKMYSSTGIYRTREANVHPPWWLWLRDTNLFDTFLPLIILHVQYHSGQQDRPVRVQILLPAMEDRLNSIIMIKFWVSQEGLIPQSVLAFQSSLLSYSSQGRLLAQIILAISAPVDQNASAAKRNPSWSLFVLEACLATMENCSPACPVALLPEMSSTKSPIWM